MRLLWMVAPVGLVPLAFTLGAAGQTASRGPTRVAFVSAQRILTESPEARAEVARFQAAQQAKTGDIRIRQQALEATRRKLAAATSPAERATLEKQEREQREGLERAAAQAQTDLQASQRQVQAELHARIRPVVEELAQREGVDLVLNADTAIVWGPTRLDLTAAVLDRLKATSQPAPKP
jgi:outer membrane protein